MLKFTYLGCGESPFTARVLNKKAPWSVTGHGCCGFSVRTLVGHVFFFFFLGHVFLEDGPPLKAVTSCLSLSSANISSTVLDKWSRKHSILAAMKVNEHKDTSLPQGAPQVSPLLAVRSQRASESWGVQLTSRGEHSRALALCLSISRDVMEWRPRGWVTLGHRLEVPETESVTLA